jgi:hypothetical protein
VAKRFTTDLVAGKIVEVDPVDTDRYAGQWHGCRQGRKMLIWRLSDTALRGTTKNIRPDLNLSLAEQEADGKDRLMERSSSCRRGIQAS